jgi:hypothetical protein
MPLRRFLPLAVVATLAACGGQPAVQSAEAAEPARLEGRDTVCYRMAYAPTPGDDEGVPFADYVALDPGPDRVARSGTEQPSGFWWMFLIGGSWQRRGDTLDVRFTNGFSGVRYLLAPTSGAALSGQVWFLYDVVDERPPPVPVTASPIACSDARLQSPPTDTAQLNALRAEREKQAFVGRERERVRRIHSPVAGTYEFEVILPDAPVLRLYGRTAAHPVSALWESEGEWEFRPSGEGTLPQAQGYQLPMAVTRTLGELPPDVGQNERGPGALAYFSMAEHPAARTADSAVWRGRLDVSFAASRMIDEPLFDAPLLRSAQLVNDVWYEGVPGSTVGRFTIDRNGQATVSMQVLREGVEVLRVRGVRISDTTLRWREGA